MSDSSTLQDDQKGLLGLARPMNETSLFVVEARLGRGLAMVAGADIARGTRILSEAPLLCVPRNTNNVALLRNYLISQVKQLSDSQQRTYLGLSNAFEGDALLNIAKTNALPLGSDAEQGGIFPTAARINHSCVPNAQNTWNNNLKQLTIHSLRDIQKGEEITITYLDNTPNSATRREHLLQSFRFKCTCELCCLPADQTTTSDECMDRMTSLYEAIGDGITIVSTPLVCLGKASELLKLLNECGLSGPLVARTYYDAFQIAIANSDQARAKVFAEKAVAERIVFEGEDSPLVEDLQALATNPATHRLYGTTRRWKSLAKQIPQDLNEQAFNDWLWKRKSK